MIGCAPAKSPSSIATPTMMPANISTIFVSWLGRGESRGGVGEDDAVTPPFQPAYRGARDGIIDGLRDLVAEFSHDGRDGAAYSSDK